MAILQEAAIQGFTHVRVIKAEDLTSATSGGAETVNVFTLPADAVVGQVGYYLTTAFDGASSSALALTIGDTADPDGWVTSTEVHVDATEVSSNVSDGAYGAFRAVDAASAGTIDAIFTPTGDSNSDIDTGEIVFFAQITDLSEVKGN